MGGWVGRRTGEYRVELVFKFKWRVGVGVKLVDGLFFFSDLEICT